MAPKRSLQQYSLDAKEAKQQKRKKTVSRRQMGETPEKTVEEEQHTETETDSPQTPSTKRTSSRPSAKRTLSSTTASKKKLKTTDHTGPRSPKASRGKIKVPDSDPKLPISWFNSQENYGKWVDWFHAKPIGYCDMIDPQLLEEMSLLKESGCSKMMNPGMDSYPRLTRLFYLNLRGVHQDDGITLESLVAGVKITITNKLLRQILDLDPECLTQPYPSKADCIARAKSEYLLPNYGNVRQLTQSSLKLEPKVVFLILVRCIVPRETSKELLTDKLLQFIYLILSGRKVDIPSLIADHMLRAVSSTRNTHLPYSNFLPLIFRAFNVPLDNEEKLSTGPSFIDAKTLQKLEIVQTTGGEWKFIRDLTDEEKNNIPNLKLKGSQNAPSSSNINTELEDTIKSMQLDILETRELMIDVAHRNNYLVEQVNFLMEKIEYFEDVIRNGKHTSTNADVPESSRQHEPSSPTDVHKKDDSSPEDIDAVLWEQAAKLKEDRDTSLLKSLAHVATSIIEEVVAPEQTAEDATDQKIAGQGLEESESAKTPQVQKDTDQDAPSEDSAAAVDASNAVADPSSSIPPAN